MVIPEYHFSPRPRAAEFHPTQVQLRVEGCFSSSGSSFFPSPLWGLVIRFSLLQVSIILIKFPSSAQEAPIVGTVAHSFSRQNARSGPLPRGCVWVALGSVPGTHWEACQYCWGSSSVAVTVAVATSAAALRALARGRWEPDSKLSWDQD